MKFFKHASILMTMVTLLSSFQVNDLLGRTKTIALDNPNIVYVGRWDKSNNKLYHSYWGGAYLRLSFTGTTIKINLKSSVNLSVSVDNGSFVFYKNVNGLTSLTEKPLARGVHTIIIAANYANDEIVFDGLELDARAKVLKPRKVNGIIEFIGDSITSGSRTSTKNVGSYAWLVGEMLDYDHTQISYPGITLDKDYRKSGGYANAPLMGQENRYFMMKQPSHDNEPWNFSQYNPDAVVINLGSNDYFVKVTSGEFLEAYINFLTKLREKLPVTKIIVLRTFAGYFTSETVAAVKNRQDAGDKNLLYIDTKDWIDLKDKSLTSDHTHPSEMGHMQLAKKLAPILKDYLKR